MRPSRFVTRLVGVSRWVAIPLLLGGCSGALAPDPELGANPTLLTTMTQGTPCYFRGVVHHCDDLNDADGDGVKDGKDRCPATPKGVPVDAEGCSLDSDGDGVTDDLDRCPQTPKRVEVDEKGCPLDRDGDGVPDDRDQCPDTPSGAKVNETGCWVLENLRFATNRHAIAAADHPLLDGVARVMKENPTLRVEIQGHTDRIGSAQSNERLSRRRAEAVRDHLAGRGIEVGRLQVIGLGFEQPIASNDTEEGRAKNRRVVLRPLP
ncbi:Peptidoglycan-associated lipoprotein [Candidatus Magnetaquicoccaceae bacterium FCR-1]|uniref:Peptidoglycan-associated lipoprotein n=1 Tax=Candidatus Magnetaquiglobus chichijimensis TaxID=3141448 RepID=A0ABQ0C8K1_9PROT